MINLQKLRYLSSICAYCNKVIPLEERTNDHVVPRCAGGVTEPYNIVICCPECNSMKGATEINIFLDENEDKSNCFYNYLRMIDYQSGSEEYSQAIIKNLSTSLQNKYFLKKAKAQAKSLARQKSKKEKQEVREQSQIQNIEYKLETNGNSFYLNELQSKILDYYLVHLGFSEHKKLADELGISNERFVREICCINNLTGVFRLKKVSENGIVLNDLFCNNLSTQIQRCYSEDKGELKLKGKMNL